MQDPGDQEIFDAAAINDIKRVRELLDIGVDINIRDHDHQSTPLQVAATRGSRQAVEFFVLRGCDINIQDDRGSTALHSLINKRYDVLAMWLVKCGADLHIKDKRGFTPRDFALDWFQKDLDAAAASKHTDEEPPPPTTPTTTTTKKEAKKV